MVVRFTDRAEADLEDIADFIAMDSPTRAATFVRDLREACLALAQHPRRFPLSEVAAGQELRRRSLGSYLIYYRVLDDAVVISRILNAARDQRRADFPET